MWRGGKEKQREKVKKEKTWILLPIMTYFIKYGNETRSPS